MGFFDKMREPVILKEESQAELQLQQLKLLEPLLDETGKPLIKQDIRNLEYGISGENSILFELTNSHLPIYVLRDIYLKHDNLSAQIDFLVFTSKVCIVIECKNLYGNIEINNRGEFIRTIEYNGKWKKEGIYSPITQNQRHLELLKKRIVDIQTNKLSKLMVEKYFEDNYISVVVLANSKAVLNMKYAKKEIKDKVIRSDQLINFINNIHNNSKNAKLSFEKHLEWAKSYIDKKNELSIESFTEKYEQYKIKTSSIPENKIPVEDTELYKKLKEFRLTKSREERIKPYFIYNDSQLLNLISTMPTSIAELTKISGFGNVKAEKYGQAILEIINKYKDI